MKEVISAISRKQTLFRTCSLRQLMLIVFQDLVSESIVEQIIQDMTLGKKYYILQATAII